MDVIFFKWITVMKTPKKCILIKELKKMNMRCAQKFDFEFSINSQYDNEIQQSQTKWTQF
jgi:hypothetical protein